MKKLLLASAVAALSVSAAQAAPTVYGKAFLTLDMNDTETKYNGETTGETNGVELNSNSSRIGIKGSEALTANTDVVYQLEYGVDVDENGSGLLDETGLEAEGTAQSDGANFYSRDTFLGLSNKQYGTLLAGKLTTIDDMVDYADVLEGGNVAGDVGPFFNEPRANNAFAYVSPSYNGMTFLGMYALDSDQDNGSLDNEDQYGVGVKYEPAGMPFKAGATYIGHDEFSHIRLSGNYALNQGLTVGAMYQMSDFDTDDNENSIVVSGEMATATPWTAYAQLNMVDNVAGASDSEAMGVGVGGKYAFSKSAIGHIYAGYKNEESGKDEFKSETDGFGVGGGLEYKF